MSAKPKGRCLSCGMPSHRQDVSGLYGTWSAIACINELRYLIQMQLGYEPDDIRGMTPCGCPWFGEAEPDVCPRCDGWVATMGADNVG